jgi:hypothetical protein
MYPVNTASVGLAADWLVGGDEPADDTGAAASAAVAAAVGVSNITNTSIQSSMAADGGAACERLGLLLAIIAAGPAGLGTLGANRPRVSAGV